MKVNYYYTKPFKLNDSINSKISFNCTQIFVGTARGVPMLFIPIFGDQLRNALKSVSTGNALFLPFTELTTKSLAAKISQMITNNTYFNRAKELARIFNDNLVHPMDEAMFWIEYVMRSKGAKHLKSKAVNMSLFSYLLLDILIIPLGVIVGVYLLIKFLKQPSNKKSETSGQKKNNKKKNK